MNYRARRDCLIETEGFFPGHRQSHTYMVNVVISRKRYTRNIVYRIAWYIVSRQKRCYDVDYQ